MVPAVRSQYKRWPLAQRHLEQIVRGVRSHETVLQRLVISRAEDTSRLGQVHVPALGLVGGFTEVGVRYMRGAIGAIPGSRLEVIPDSFDPSNLCQPEAFDQLLRRLSPADWVVKTMPRTRKPGAQRRREILTTARELFLAQGYSRVVMDDIARACGLARTTLYEYYPNKEQILVGLIDQALDAAHAIVPAGSTCRARLTDVAAKRLERLLNNRTTYQLIFRELPSLSGPIGQRFVAERLREWQQVMAEAQAAIAAGEIRRNVVPADLAFAFDALVAQRAGELLMLPGDDADPEAEAERLVRLLWFGVGNDGYAN